MPLLITTNMGHIDGEKPGEFSKSAFNLLS